MYHSLLEHQLSIDEFVDVYPLTARELRTIKKSVTSAPAFSKAVNRVRLG